MAQGVAESQNIPYTIFVPSSTILLLNTSEYSYLYESEHVWNKFPLLDPTGIEVKYEILEKIERDENGNNVI